jgi:FemAB-related protein (PEP-CTERM system-associated)
MMTSPLLKTEVILHERAALEAALPRLAEYAIGSGAGALSRDPAWLLVLAEGLQHAPYCFEAIEEGRTRGFLPLSFVKSALFGRFLVSLPYLNSGGVIADDPDVAAALIDRAVGLADLLKARHLELRHERPIEHPAFNHRIDNKVHMRLALPTSVETLWNGFDPKVRNQIRKGQKHEMTVLWGGEELMPEFYDVLSRNMRDLGTPVFGKPLFRSILRRFPERAELCVTRFNGRASAVAMLLHGRGTTEVPTASSLREFNAANANMLMYWHLLQRAIERGQSTFDFGRSSRESNTFRFKKQWGAAPETADWQFQLRTGEAGAMRPENAKFQLMIRVWQRLPVALTRLIGPAIVRGIP